MEKSNVEIKKLEKFGKIGKVIKKIFVFSFCNEKLLFILGILMHMFSIGHTP